MSSSIVLVCTRCRAANADPDTPRAGAALLAAVRLAAAPGVQVAGIACLSGCKRACAAAVLAPGKVGYLFGDLPPDADGAADLLAVAQAHGARADGFLPRAARPERLRGGILARLPPLHWISGGSGEVIAWPA
jgi:predicted metal-binding protein